jgi:hypothetical protein
MRIWVAIAVLMAALSWVDACVHRAALEKLQHVCRTSNSWFRDCANNDQELPVERKENEDG